LKNTPTLNLNHISQWFRFCLGTISESWWWKEFSGFKKGL